MNSILIIGKIYNLSVEGKRTDFYLASERLSGVSDTVICHGGTDEIGELNNGDCVSVFGSVNTKNYTGDDGKRHLTIYVNVKEVSRVTEDSDIHDTNVVTLDGFICRNPLLRITPKGSTVCDITLASNRENKKTDYIPCIAWNGIANIFSQFPIGTYVSVIGRLQSRNYKKVYENGVEELKVAYEVSIKSLEDYEMKEETSCL